MLTTFREKRSDEEFRTLFNRSNKKNLKFQKELIRTLSQKEFLEWFADCGEEERDHYFHRSAILELAVEKNPSVIASLLEQGCSTRTKICLVVILFTEWDAPPAQLLASIPYNREFYHLLLQEFVDRFYTSGNRSEGEGMQTLQTMVRNRGYDSDFPFGEFGRKPYPGFGDFVRETLKSL